MVNWGDRRLPQRFWDKVSPEPNSGCWLWVGTGHSGYGQLGGGVARRKRPQEFRTRYAHRIAYEALVGPIPGGLFLDHLCRTRCCVNPAHLEPVTGAENTRRGDGGLWNAAKTHCPNGHEYSEANTIVVRTRRARECRECTRARKNEWKRRTRERQRQARQNGATP